MTKWIKTKDELPSNDDFIVVWYEDDYVIAYYCIATKAFDSPELGWMEVEDVPYWAELPKEPVDE